jgi:hypothetical protein
MPRQNRVNPFGEIIATHDRGMFMGNRGVLHDQEGRIQRAWQGKRWIVCVLEFRGRKRTVMSPRHYTELFFLDEATALAAGHRPCAECRRERFNAFRYAWRLEEHSHPPTADEIDNRLHTERLAPDKKKKVHLANLADLPNGVFVKMADWGENAYLVWNDRLLLWTAGGYSGQKKRPHDAKVVVLTPKSTVEAIRAGYVPEIHPSAVGAR